MTAPPTSLDDALILPSAYREQGRPVSEWEWLLRNDPIHWTEAEGREPFWAITRHRDVSEVAHQPGLFSSEAGGIMVLTEVELGSRRPEGEDLTGMRIIITMDPPDHRTFRKVAAGYFSPRNIKSLTQVIETTAQGIVAELATHGDEPVDFLETVAERHPVRVLCTILGVPRDQEDELLYITEHLFDREDNSLSREEQAKAEADLGARVLELFSAIIADRRENPRADLATLLATAVLENGEPMGMAETLGYYLIVFTAGHDTTKYALAGGVAAFLDNPGEWRRLRENRSLINPAVEEIVRFTAPVNYSGRTAMADCEIGGVPIHKGDRLALYFGAANRDPEVFSNPQVFNIGRDPNRHLGFGWSEHFCLGAHLARSSLSAVIGVLAERIESMEAAGSPSFAPASLVHGYRSLPIRVHWV